MTLTIELPPDVEKALEERARRAGNNVAEFAAALVTQAATLDQESDPPERQAEIAARLAALGRIGSYDVRARSGMPPLSNHASSRESIYEERGL